MAEPGDGNNIKTRWQANERRLNEIAAMTGLGREMHAAETERLEAAQDAIEYELGSDGRPGSRRWSGARQNDGMSDESKKRPLAWVIWAALVVLLLAYPLSTGPALWWASAKGPHSERWDTLNTVYAPLDWLGKHCDWFDKAMIWYGKKFLNP